MIAIGSDHRGYKLKEKIKQYLEELGIEYKDFGCYSEERTDSPLIVRQVVKSIKEKECDKGILLCGTGNAVSMTANKYRGIYCANCFNEDMAKYAKAHTNANILAIPAEYVDEKEAVKMIRMWLATEFLEGRYRERIQMIEEIENENMK